MSFFALSLLGIAAFWTQRLSSGSKRLRTALGDFGGAPVSTLSRAERQTLLAQYMRQQRSAFGLVWFSVAAAIVLGIILVARVIIVSKLDLSVLTGAVGAIGDFGLGTYASKIYRETTNRVNELVTSSSLPARKPSRARV
jgi:hypothetical protein